jgi:hypothetical protein
MELKDYMTMEEMRELHQEYYPYLKVNNVNVGRLATKLGYVRLCQMQGKKPVSIYLKKSSNLIKI